jgi:hypothetical protein
MKITNATTEQWWASLPAGEKDVIRSIMRMLRSAKQSQVRDVARAADKWEKGIGCFIKVRLMHTRRRRPFISCQLASRNRPGVSPAQD